MKTKQTMRLEIKEITAEGSFEGILSPYGNVDGGNDVVVKGAYDKTLKEQGDTRPLLWQHDPKQPIGQLSLEDRADGLWAKGQLLMDLDNAKNAYLLIKAGIVKGLSIGFTSVKDSIEKGVRQLKEIKLYEGSIVTFPMNEMALITNVKARKEQKDDFNEELAEVQLSQAGWQMQCALQNALSSALYSGLSRDEVISLSQTVIEQFSAAYMEYLPAYLDMLTEYYGDLETWSAKRKLETKEGRVISSDNMGKLSTALEHMKSAHDVLSGVLDSGGYGSTDKSMKADAKKKTVDGVELTADCFAYVGDPDKTETWKLPIKFPGDDEKTKSHIRNALARFSQTEGIPDGEREAVLAKIHAAAKKYGIDVADKAAEFSISEKVKALLDEGAGAATTPTGAGAATTTSPKAADKSLTDAVRELIGASA